MTHPPPFPPRSYSRVSVIDSHTEGEPTRVVISGGPDLGTGTLCDKLKVFREKFDWFRSAVVNEPRGSDAVVGALLLPPANPAAACAVIFFNNQIFLHSCGHGTIGLAVTLAHLNRIAPGTHIIETPVGDVTVHLDAGRKVCMDNVPAFVHAPGVNLTVAFEGADIPIAGDIAWGGNWFFLTESSPIPVHARNIDRLTQFSRLIALELARRGITGRNGQPVDHIELFGPAERSDCHAKNFVLCSGGEYDRSPCGTGTSAKLACLHAAGKLQPGEKRLQESIIGSAFSCWYRLGPTGIIPTICGDAYICSESTLLLDSADPFVHGIRL